MKSLNEIEIVDYDPNWPKVFKELSKVLSDHLGDLILRIEHVGSTAVPGLDAKPIIDIDVIISSEGMLQKVITRLEKMGYVHEGDLGITGRETFKPITKDVPRDGTGRIWPKYHLYVCEQNSKELLRHLKFRDYLRDHPEQARAYAKLKRELAGKYLEDRQAYTEAKTQFIKSILKSER